jgi:hypothetical protein
MRWAVALFSCALMLAGCDKQPQPSQQSDPAKVAAPPAIERVPPHSHYISDQLRHYGAATFTPVRGWPDPPTLPLSYVAPLNCSCNLGSERGCGDVCSASAM